MTVGLAGCSALQQYSYNVHRNYNEISDGDVRNHVGVVVENNKNVDRTFEVEVVFDGYHEKSKFVSVEGGDFNSVEFEYVSSSGEVESKVSVSVV